MAVCSQKMSSFLKRAAVVAVAFAPVVSDAASAGETDFVWKRKDRAGKDAWRLPAAMRDDETFSVRFSLATVGGSP